MFALLQTENTRGCNEFVFTIIWNYAYCVKDYEYVQNYTESASYDEYMINAERSICQKVYLE
jgi:hypothetical protein